jgi:hypothetical protein
MTQPTITEITTGLRYLADFLEAHPELPYPTYLCTPSVWCPMGLDEVQTILRAALADKIPVIKEHSETQRNVALDFGGLAAKALVSKSEVCERVVVGTETVQVPDPSFIPPETPLIEKTVDVTEWRCRPLLAPAES